MRLLHLIDDLRRSRSVAPGLHDWRAKTDELRMIASANAWLRDEPWLGPRYVGAASIGAVTGCLVFLALLQADSAGLVPGSPGWWFAGALAAALLVTRLLMAHATWPLTPGELLLARLRGYRPVDVEAHRVLMEQAAAPSGMPFTSRVQTWLHREHDAVSKMPIWSVSAVRRSKSSKEQPWT